MFSCVLVTTVQLYTKGVSRKIKTIAELYRKNLQPLYFVLSNITSKFIQDLIMILN